MGFDINYNRDKKFKELFNNAKNEAIKNANDSSLIQQAKTNYPVYEVWTVLAAHTDNTYDLIKSAGNEYLYSRNNPGEEYELSEGGLWKNLYDGSRFGGVLTRVPSIIPKKQSNITAGDVVQVAYYNRSRHKPYIKRLVYKSAPNLTEDQTPPEPPSGVGSGVWMQAEANPGCNRVVRDSSAPFPWLDSGNTLSTLLTMYRYYYSGALQGGAPGSLSFLTLQREWCWATACRPR